MVPLIVVIVLLVIGFLAWKTLSSKSGGDAEYTPESVDTAQPEAAQPTPIQPIPVQPAVVQTYAAAPQPLQTQPAPVGTAHLDEPGAARPDVDATALASARSAVANVGAAVPEGVLADALLDTTPDQLRQMFASVPQDVLHEVVDARDNVHPQPLKKEEAAQLQGMADSLDDLDIWSFGESKA